MFVFAVFDRVRVDVSRDFVFPIMLTVEVAVDCHVDVRDGCVDGVIPVLTWLTAVALICYNRDVCVNVADCCCVGVLMT
jgi:hypothetical protein